MNDLWFSLAGLAAFGLIFLLWPLFFSRKPSGEKGSVLDEKRQQMNDSLYQEQLTEIEQEFKGGALTEQQKQRRVLELQRIRDNDRVVEDTLVSDNVDSSQSRRLSLIVCLTAAIALPLMAGVTYWYTGFAPDLEITRLDKQLTEYVGANEFDEQAEGLLQQLRDKLEIRVVSDPENLRNWYLLANVAYDQRDVKRTIEAYTKVLEQNPDSPGVMSNLVQVLYVASGNKFTNESRQLFNKAVSQDPNNTGLLILGGLDAFDNEKFDDSYEYWLRALSLTSSTDPRYPQMQEFVAQAQVRRLQASGGQEESDSETAIEAQVGDKSISLAISAAEHVDAKPTDRVFIYARAWQGPPMPLSIVDLTVGDLPATVRLDSSKSMIEGMTLDRFPEVELVARISSTGRNTAMPGEWEVTKGPIALTEQEYNAVLVISQKRQ